VKFGKAHFDLWRGSSPYLFALDCDIVLRRVESVYPSGSRQVRKLDVAATCVWSLDSVAMLLLCPQ
jgi:hypothetical protein